MTNITNSINAFRETVRNSLGLPTAAERAAIWSAVRGLPATLEQMDDQLASVASELEEKLSERDAERAMDDKVQEAMDEFERNLDIEREVEDKVQTALDESLSDEVGKVLEENLADAVRSALGDCEDEIAEAVDEVLQKSDRVAKLETELAGLRALVVALLADNSTTDERFAALVRVNDSEHAAPVKFEAHRLLQLVQATDAQTAPAAPVADVK